MTNFDAYVGEIQQDKVENNSLGRKVSYIDAIVVGRQRSRRVIGQELLLSGHQRGYFLAKDSSYGHHRLGNRVIWK